MIVRGFRSDAPRPRLTWSPWWSLVLCSIVAGCATGDGLDRRAVSGTVTLDGRPIVQGVLMFEPTSDAVGTSVGASIRDGRFTIPRREGPVPGPYLARIYASSGVLAPLSGKATSPLVPRPMIELIPERYNRRSTLGVVVPPRGPSSFRFRLTSDPPVDHDRAGTQAAD